MSTIEAAGRIVASGFTQEEAGEEGAHPREDQEEEVARRQAVGEEEERRHQNIAELAS